MNYFLNLAFANKIFLKIVRLISVAVNTSVFGIVSSTCTIPYVNVIISGWIWNQSALVIANTAYHVIFVLEWAWYLASYRLSESFPTRDWRRFKFFTIRYHINISITIQYLNNIFNVTSCTPVTVNFVQQNWYNRYQPLFCWWLIWRIQNDAKKLKNALKTLANGYSSRSTPWELSNGYQHDRV